MQTKVDERKLLVQHGSDVHQMLNPRLPTQTTTIGQARWSRCLRPNKRTSANSVWEVQSVRLLLSKGFQLGFFGIIC